MRSFLPLDVLDESAGFLFVVLQVLMQIPNLVYLTVS